VLQLKKTKIRKVNRRILFQQLLVFLTVMRIRKHYGINLQRSISTRGVRHLVEKKILRAVIYLTQMHDCLNESELIIIKLLHSKYFINSLVHAFVWVLFFKVGDVKFTLVKRWLMQISFDVFRLAILFPIIKFELLFHDVVLRFVPHPVVSKFDTSNDSYRQAYISC
jgi:hypothetical protein